jgi:hypothetical protein
MLKRIITVIFSLPLVSGFSEMEGINAQAGKLVNGVLVSESDDRTYLPTTLPNGLKALLISDPSTDMAAASIGCGVGSLDDEDDLPGQAHFTGKRTGLLYSSIQHKPTMLSSVMSMISTPKSMHA